MGTIPFSEAENGLFGCGRKNSSVGRQDKARRAAGKIRALEGQLGIELPEEYVSFLTQTGDGWEKQVVRCALWPEMKSLLA